MKKRKTHHLKPFGVENWLCRRLFGYNFLDHIGLWSTRNLRSLGLGFRPQRTSKRSVPYPLFPFLNSIFYPLNESFFAPSPREKIEYSKLGNSLWCKRMSSLFCINPYAIHGWYQVFFLCAVLR